MRIQTRFILALSTLALVLVLAIVLLFQWRFDNGLIDYVNAQQRARLEGFAAELALRWQDDPGWEYLQADRREFHRLWQRPAGGRGPAGPDERGPPPPDDDMHDGRGPPPDRNRHPPRAEGPPPPPPPVVLFDANHALLIGHPPADGQPTIEVPVLVDGTVRGWLAMPRVAQLQQDVDRRFRADQLRTLWLVGALALLFAIVVAVLLARHFTQPLTRLSRAAHRLTQQQYDIDVDDSRRDELGTLARDINELAATLARNADARQRWFADISHELRTPLAILSGEIDAVLDGVRPLTRERIESLQQEVAHLRRLVEDLYTLARADLGALQYRKTDINFAALLRERIELAQPAFAHAGLQLAADLPAHMNIHADEDRLQQLIDNLLGNSLRYTDAGGRVQVTLAAQGGLAELIIEDSAPGVPEPALPKLFDHLFRVDAARNRASGGAGLGLAICKRVVEAHAGRISAAHSALGGLRISVQLPVGNASPAANANNAARKSSP